MQGDRPERTEEAIARMDLGHNLARLAISMMMELNPFQMALEQKDSLVRAMMIASLMVTILENIRNKEDIHSCVGVFTILGYGREMLTCCDILRQGYQQSPETPIKNNYRVKADIDKLEELIAELKKQAQS